MAEYSQANTVRNKHSCPICLETFKSPRSTPGCKHSFCEECLFTFVFNLKEKGEIDTSFECPVCRVPCEMKESGVVTMEWIQTFPVYTESDDRDGSDSQKENLGETRNCGSCAEEDKAVTRNKYCLDCESFICDECFTAHGRYKALKKHKVLSQDEIDCSFQVYEEAQNLSKCSKHSGHVFEFYCSLHETLMCLMCAATSHKECKHVLDLSDCAALNVEKTHSLKARIEGTEKYLNLLKHISKDNCESVKSKVQSYRNDLQNMKDDIIKRLNDIVDNEHAFSKQVIIDVEDNTFAYTQKIENLKSVYKKKLSFLQSVEQNVRPREFFVCVEKVLSDIEEFDIQIYHVESDFKVADVDLKTTGILNKLNEKLAENLIPKNIVKFHRPAELPILEELQCSHFIVENVESHNVRLIDVCSPTYSNITMRKDGELVMCDRCGNKCGFIVLYDPRNKTKQKLKIEKPLSASPMNGNSVAITMCDTKSISIISFGQELTECRNIATKQTPRGLASLKDGKVAISWNDPPAFSISDISGPEIQHVTYFTEDTNGRKFKFFDHLAINEKRQCVIQPCTKDKVVYCFTFKQQPVFKYENNLKSPTGVAVDPKSGCVFVCDESDNGIHQVSALGEPISIIKHDTLKYPLSVCYDVQRNCLWVSKARTYEEILCFKAKRRT